MSPSRLLSQKETDDMQLERIRYHILNNAEHLVPQLRAYTHAILERQAG